MGGAGVVGDEAVAAPDQAGDREATQSYRRGSLQVNPYLPPRWSVQRSACLRCASNRTFCSQDAFLSGHVRNHSKRTYAAA